MICQEMFMSKQSTMSTILEKILSIAIFVLANCGKIKVKAIYSILMVVTPITAKKTENAFFFIFW